MRFLQTFRRYAVEKVSSSEHFHYREEEFSLAQDSAQYGRINGQSLKAEETLRHVS